MTEKEPAIVTHRLTRDFPSVRALDQLSITVTEGTIYGFLGPNGAGKTTTLLLLLGLLEPSGGEAKVLGFDPRTQGSDVRERCGALLENTGLYDQLSAEDNLAFYARAWHLSPQIRHQRIRALLEQMGLWQRRRERVAKWSRGMRQKLAVARALLHQPSLLFLDEPTAGLDVVASNALRNHLGSLVAAEGITVFLTTHNMAEAEQLCHRVAVIRNGALLAVGSPEDLRVASSAHTVVRGQGGSPEAIQRVMDQPGVATANLDRDSDRWILKLDPSADISQVVRQLVLAGVSVEEVSREKASLEEVFLALVEEER